jgi:hypothetical protein
MTAPALNFGQQALAAYHARHAAADDISFNAASFYHDGTAYIVTVRDYIVLVTRKLAEVRAFSEMHNNRIA